MVFPACTSYVVSQTVVGPGGVRSAKRFLDFSNDVAVGGDFLDNIYEVYAVSFIGRTGTIEVNTQANQVTPAINITGGAVGYFSWGRLNQCVRDIDDALRFNADGRQYDPEMSNYPTVQRFTEGLRNEGGIAKVLPDAL